MALKITVRPSATAAPTIDIKPETIAEVEAAYAELLKNPGSELHLAFEDEDERLSWSRQARAYCMTRPEGALRFRQLPSKNLPVNEMRVQITADLEENGARKGRRKA